MGDLFTFFCFLVLFFSTGVVGQITFTVPKTTPVCQSRSLQVTWSGGTGPYKLGVIPGGEDGSKSQAYHSIAAQITGSSVTWDVDIGAGVSISLFIVDSKKVSATSSVFTILSSSDPACSVGSPPPTSPPDTSKPTPPQTNTSPNPPPSSPSPSNNAPSTSPTPQTSVPSTPSAGSDQDVLPSSDPSSNAQSTDTSSSGDTSANASHQSNTGAVVGGVVGTLVIIAAIGAFIFFCLKRRQRRRARIEEDQFGAEVQPYTDNRLFTANGSNNRASFSYPFSSGISPPPEPYTPSYEMSPRSSPIAPQSPRMAGTSVSGLSYAGSSSTAGTSDLTPEQANFVRDLYDHGVAPSAVASVIQSMVSGRQTPNGIIPPALYEKGVAVSAERQAVTRPLSDQSIALAPPRYSECPM